MSAVISSAMGVAILRGKQGKLFVACARAERLRSPVANSERSSEPPHLVPGRLRLGTPQVRAARVEPLVVRKELRPVAGEALEEMLARPGPQVQQVRPDPACA